MGQNKLTIRPRHATLHCIGIDVIQPFGCNTNKRSFHFSS